MHTTSTIASVLGVGINPFIGKKMSLLVNVLVDYAIYAVMVFCYLVAFIVSYTVMVFCYPVEFKVY